MLGRRLEVDGDLTTRDRLVPIMRGGEEVWLSVTEAVMRDPAGAVAGRIYAFRDISADRLVEEMKSDFVATVSQELRRPLTSIYGFAETLLRRDVHFGDEERRTFLGYIASESERLTAIVDTLLNVARLDTGDLQVSLAPTDVSARWSRTSVADRSEAASDGHRFVVDCRREPLAAEADAEKLRQVLANLRRERRQVLARRRHGHRRGAPAGRRASRSRSPTRASASRPASTSGSSASSTAPSTRRPGSRAARASGCSSRGGWSTAMGGRIWVTSREGKGRSFTFELPAAASRSEALPERV